MLQPIGEVPTHHHGPAAASLAAAKRSTRPTPPRAIQPMYWHWRWVFGALVPPLEPVKGPTQTGHSWQSLSCPELPPAFAFPSPIPPSCSRPGPKSTLKLNSYLSFHAFVSLDQLNFVFTLNLPLWLFILSLFASFSFPLSGRTGYSAPLGHVLTSDNAITPVRISTSTPRSRSLRPDLTRGTCKPAQSITPLARLVCLSSTKNKPQVASIPTSEANTSKNKSTQLPSSSRSLIYHRYAPPFMRWSACLPCRSSESHCIARRPLLLAELCCCLGDLAGCPFTPNQTVLRVVLLVSRVVAIQTHFSPPIAIWIARPRAYQSSLRQQ